MTQKSITSFFKASNKSKSLVRGFHGDESTVLDDVTNKKIKLSEPANKKKNQEFLISCASGNGETLTTDQQTEIKMKKVVSESKLQCKQSLALHENIGIGWYEALKNEFSKPYFVELGEFLMSERKKNSIYPPEHQVYSWTQFCDIKEIKVVILGQDPYHGVGQAHGLCFSVQIGVHPPPSLVNMYKELEKDIAGFKNPGHGYLVGWARQGVLLLNACLTVRANNANSHKDKGWEKFSDAVIKTISDSNDGVVFLLWGSYAQKKAAIVDKTKHHFLNAPHPSPLSAHRGFFGCKHFSKCNLLLKEKGLTPVDWSLLPAE